MYPSKRLYEEDVATSGFGLLNAKVEGRPGTYLSQSQLWTARYTNVPYEGKFRVTFEHSLTNQYVELANKRARLLGNARRQTIETIAANVYNRVTNGDYLGGDGVVLGSASHPSAAGNWSNILTPARDIGEKAIEDLITQILNCQDDNGQEMNLKPLSIHIPPDLWFETLRILESELQNWTANNAVNALRISGQFPKGIKLNDYFTDADAWFIRTSCPDGMKGFVLHEYDIKNEYDFETDDERFKTYWNGCFGWSDPRGLFMSVGI